MNTNNELISKAEVFKTPTKEETDKSVLSEQDDTVQTAETSVMNTSISNREKGFDSPSSSFKFEEDITMSPLIRMGSIPELQDEGEANLNEDYKTGSGIINPSLISNC